jgi:hypothetical protein
VRVTSRSHRETDEALRLVDRLLKLAPHAYLTDTAFVAVREVEAHLGCKLPDGYVAESLSLCLDNMVAEFLSCQRGI